MKQKNFMFLVTSVYLALMCMGKNDDAYARSSVTTKTVQTYRGLIIQGERPEIISCMTAATHSIKDNSGFDQINWDKASTDTAVVNEKVLSDHQLIRSVRIDAMARVRAYSFFDNYEKVQINCTQVNQASPRVSISAFPGDI